MTNLRKFCHNYVLRVRITSSPEFRRRSLRRQFFFVAGHFVAGHFAAGSFCRQHFVAGHFAAGHFAAVLRGFKCKKRSQQSHSHRHLKTVNRKLHKI